MHDDSTPQTARCQTQPAGERNRRSKSRGQSLVEFAVLVPVLIMFLALAADYGRALTAYIAVSSAAREGAAVGMQSGTLVGIEEAVDADIGGGGTIWGNPVQVSPSIVANDGFGYKQVVVKVEYTFNPIIPLPKLPSSIPMSRTVKMRVLN